MPLRFLPRLQGGRVLFGLECCWIWVIFSQREGGVRHPRFRFPVFFLGVQALVIMRRLFFKQRRAYHGPTLLKLCKMRKDCTRVVVRETHKRLKRARGRWGCEDRVAIFAGEDRFAISWPWNNNRLNSLFSLRSSLSLMCWFPVLWPTL